MNPAIQPALTLSRASFQKILVRSFYYKFKRTRVPPLQEPRESPYIVGPYLKPDYLPREYITEPLKHHHVDDFDWAIYEFEKIEPDPERKIELLLIEDVEGLGVAGQVVDALAQRGAAKLVAMRKAEYYTEFARKWYKFGPRSDQSASSALSPRTARMLRSRIYKLPVSERTVVKPWHISLALRLSGCVCPVDAIDESSIENYYDEEDARHLKCTVVINNHERVEVRFAYNEKEQFEET